MHPKGLEGSPARGQATSPPREAVSVPALCALSRGCRTWCPLCSEFLAGFCLVSVVLALTGCFLSPAPPISLPLVPPAVPPFHRRLLVPRLEPDILLRAKQDFLKIDSAADLQ